MGENFCVSSCSCLWVHVEIHVLISTQPGCHRFGISGDVSRFADGATSSCAANCTGRDLTLPRIVIEISSPINRSLGRLSRSSSSPHLGESTTQLILQRDYEQRIALRKVSAVYPFSRGIGGQRPSHISTVMERSRIVDAAEEHWEKSTMRAEFSMPYTGNAITAGRGAAVSAASVTAAVAHSNADEESTSVWGKRSHENEIAVPTAPERWTAGGKQSSVECNYAAGGAGGIDNKIEQAMDLVKSHLMFAVREEVDVLREKITELNERNEQLTQEVQLLRSLLTTEQTTHYAQLLKQQHIGKAGGPGRPGHAPPTTLPAAAGGGVPRVAPSLAAFGVPVANRPTAASTAAAPTGALPGTPGTPQQ
ncbi:hypothetical protein BIW11_04847, partial [Tropilaelaps mercedesae]